MSEPTKMPRFVGTVTLGNILTMVVLIIPIVAWGFQTKSSVEQNAKGIQRHDTMLEKINETQQATLRQLVILETKFTDHVDKNSK